ncbi:FAD-binding oxidoreductase [Paracoccus sp. Z118]|uniref:NAD(P)/FAD-dependent oxidoreductase n=1 Tax=Paracoccus sp. Z118 TaxID=2851017 RepID=UPI001C2CAC19|nr:FAD-dependent oxidoreductase [Paracoccus sp. Z118]MBV0890963.1 FAD-binding oxidoreductase [Paracoccus sp. Z118]
MIRRDALIIGGGIHGCATALNLRHAGASVTLFEKDYAGRHASGVNAGGVRMLSRHVAEIPLSLRSMEIWERIGDVVGDDCALDCHGQVLVAETDSDFEDCKARVAELNALGFTHEELLSAAEIRAILPAVAETCRGGIISRRDGAAQPARATTAFRRKAGELGADIREGVAAGMPRFERGLWHVEAGGEEFAAPNLVIAAGAWAGRIAAHLGDPIPMEPVAPMLMITSRVPHFIDPVVILRSRILSFKQFPNGTLLIGGGHLGKADLDTNGTVLDWNKLQTSARTVSELFPVMRNATIVRAWAGIEGKLSDDLPVVGPSPRHKGLFYQCGFSLHGFQLGPAAGAVMAELVTEGRTPTDISGLSMARFNAS